MISMDKNIALELLSAARTIRLGCEMEYDTKLVKGPKFIYFIVGSKVAEFKIDHVYFECLEAYWIKVANDCYPALDSLS